MKVIDHLIVGCFVVEILVLGVCWLIGGRRLAKDIVLYLFLFMGQIKVILLWGKGLG